MRLHAKTAKIFTKEMKITLAAVRRIASSLENVEEGTAWSFPAFRTNGRLFAAVREDLKAVVVRISFEDRDEMIAADPNTYFTTDHHRSYPCVLAHLSEIHPEAVHDLLVDGWRLMAAKPRKKRKAATSY